MLNYLSGLLRDAGRRFVPFLDWIGDLKRPEILKADIVAGITVALVLIPQSMANAQLAGLPPEIGLYSAFLVPIVAAIFGSSRQLQNGPSRRLVNAIDWGRPVLNSIRFHKGAFPEHC